MAKVQIADVIEPSIFLKYVTERTTELSALFSSGIISTAAEITAAAVAGGRTANMPFWQELTGTSEVLSDEFALTPQKLGSAQDVSVLHLRGAAWAVNDLADAVAGDDPMGSITLQGGEWWAKEFQRLLNLMLIGIFDTALDTTHKLDVGTDDVGAPADAELFDNDKFLTASYLLGDHESMLSAICCHSTIEQRMRQLDLIDYIKPSEASPRIPIYGGRRVIVDDSVPKIVGSNRTKFFTLLYGPGAIGYGEGRAKQPVEIDRDSLANDDLLINRRHFILHPRGVAWQGSPTGAAPEDSDLSNGANWTKVYNDKNIRVVALVTNG